MSKRDKYVGKKISRKEALKDLGDPKTWKREDEKIRKEMRMKPGNKKWNRDNKKIERELKTKPGK